MYRVIYRGKGKVLVSSAWPTDKIKIKAVF